MTDASPFQPPEGALAFSLLNIDDEALFAAVLRADLSSELFVLQDVASMLWMQAGSGDAGAGHLQAPAIVSSYAREIALPSGDAGTITVIGGVAAPDSAVFLTRAGTPVVETVSTSAGHFAAAVFTPGPIAVSQLTVQVLD